MPPYRLRRSRGSGLPLHREWRSDDLQSIRLSGATSAPSFQSQVIPSTAAKKPELCTPTVHQPGGISRCCGMLPVGVFGLSMRFCNIRQPPETRQILLVMSRSAVRVRSSALFIQLRALHEGRVGTVLGHQSMGGGEDELVASEASPEKARVVNGAWWEGDRFWVAFSEVVIIVRRLICEAWRRYRRECRSGRADYLAG